MSTASAEQLNPSIFSLRGPLGMSALPPQAGYLRPATVALRHIFGYSDDSLNTPLALEANFGAKICDSLITDLLLV